MSCIYVPKITFFISYCKNLWRLHYFFCVTNNLKLGGLKQHHFIISDDVVGQEFQQGWLGDSASLGVSWGCSVVFISWLVLSGRSKMSLRMCLLPCQGWLDPELSPPLSISSQGLSSRYPYKDSWMSYMAAQDSNGPGRRTARLLKT